MNIKIASAVLMVLMAVGVKGEKMIYFSFFVIQFLIDSFQMFLVKELLWTPL